MKRRLLIVGASGFVGSRWALAADTHFEVTRAARHAPGDSAWVTIDITDPESVRAAFDLAQPELVTLLAAMSDIDRCQREPELAELINVDGATNVAHECARRGVGLMYTSTDAVFDGSNGFYREDDPPTPPNWYGHTKARAERAIRELLPSATIVRLSLVLGLSVYGAGNSYLDKLIGQLRGGIPIVTPTYEFRNPIDVGTLCEFFAELAQPGTGGIFHVGASDKISRYDLARAIAERLGCDSGLIVPQSEPVPGRAPAALTTFWRLIEYGANVARRYPAVAK